MTDTQIISDVVTGGLSPFARVAIPRTRPTADVLDRLEVLHRQVLDLQSNASAMRRQGLVEELEDRQQFVAASSGTNLLEVLSETGFAWRDIARLAQVSVPAVQKWRRGEGMSGTSRYRMAKVAALLDVLANHFISEPVSWLEMPVKEGVALSRMDMLAENRFDLVLELVSDDGDPASVDTTLDEFKPDWRKSLIDEDFETFVAADGVVSIRPRG